MRKCPNSDIRCVQVLTEGANMPSSADAIEAMHEKKVEFGPAKAANAGASACATCLCACAACS